MKQLHNRYLHRNNIWHFNKLQYGRMKKKDTQMGVLTGIYHIVHLNSKAQYLQCHLYFNFKLNGKIRQQA